MPLYKLHKNPPYYGKRWTLNKLKQLKGKKIIKICTHRTNAIAGGSEAMHKITKAMQHPRERHSRSPQAPQKGVPHPLPPVRREA